MTVILNGIAILLSVPICYNFTSEDRIPISLWRSQLKRGGACRD
jgi:hypothetical protein